MELIIDGDVLCHDACRVPWAIRVEEFKEDGIDTELFKNVREIPDYDPLADLTTLMACWQSFLKGVVKLQERFFVESCLIAVKGEGNFRDDLYPDYKAKRNVYRVHNPFVDIIRRKAVKVGLAVAADGREADDYVRIWATEASRYQRDFVVASIDKDLLCIPGKHWNMQKETLIHVSPMDAMRNFYAQLLQGDSVDQIPGLPNVGPKKAQSALSDCLSEEDFQETVVGMYIAEFGDDWEQYLLSNGKLLHIQSHLNEYFTICDWPIVKQLRGLR